MPHVLGLLYAHLLAKIENDCYGGCNRTVSTWCSVWWVKIQPAPHPLLFYPLDWLLYPMHTHQASKNSILISPIYDESFANTICRILNQGHYIELGYKLTRVRKKWDRNDM